jgi:hypothetical protein
MQEAALCLLKNDFRLAALMLVFTTIDQMAWLSLPGDEEVKGKDFMAWVSTYMLGRNQTGLEAVTAADLLGGQMWLASYCNGRVEYSLTMRTARSMTSGGYLGCFSMTPFSQTMEPLQNPGRLTTTASPHHAPR